MFVVLSNSGIYIFELKVFYESLFLCGCDIFFFYFDWIFLIVQGCFCWYYGYFVVV